MNERTPARAAVRTNDVFFMTSKIAITPTQPTWAQPLIWAAACARDRGSGDDGSGQRHAGEHDLVVLFVARRRAIEGAHDDGIRLAGGEAANDGLVGVRCSGRRSRDD